MFRGNLPLVDPFFRIAIDSGLTGIHPSTQATILEILKLQKLDRQHVSQLSTSRDQMERIIVLSFLPIESLVRRASK